MPIVSAIISADGLYRYLLVRQWKAGRFATFVMLNPSTADGSVDDPTIRRCVGFARSWGCAGIKVLNLYAYRATSPSELWTATDPVGPLNDGYLREHCITANALGWPVVVAWGNNARPERVNEFAGLPGTEALHCLGTTKAGSPRHPLYIRADTELRPVVLWPGGQHTSHSPACPGGGEA